jgi:hypothetical protein
VPGTPGAVCCALPRLGVGRQAQTRDAAHPSAALRPHYLPRCRSRSDGLRSWASGSTRRTRTGRWRTSGCGTWMHCTGTRGPSTTTAPGPSHSSSTSRSRCRLSGVTNALPWAVDSDGNFVNLLMTRRSYWHDEGSVLSFKFECWVSSFNGWRPGEGRSHTRFTHVCQLRVDCLRDTGDAKNVNTPSGAGLENRGARTASDHLFLSENTASVSFGNGGASLVPFPT